MKYYQLHITCKADRQIYESISNILGVQPLPFQPSKVFPTQTYTDWVYEI